MRFAKVFALLMMGIGLACFFGGSIWSAIVEENILIHGESDKIWIAGLCLFFSFMGRYGALKEDTELQKLKDDIEGKT